MKILYFAWLRERLNRDGEEVDLPESVKTVGGLLDYLAEKDEVAEFAFQDRTVIRAAVDDELVPHDAPITNAQTVALFPPMTGG